MIDMDDDAVLVDVLNGAQPKLHAHVSLALAEDLTPSVERLINSEYEDYLLTGLTAAGSTIRAVSSVMRDTAEAAHYHQGGHSLQFEERLERCEALADALRALSPRLEPHASAVAYITPSKP